MAILKGSLLKPKKHHVNVLNNYHTFSFTYLQKYFRNIVENLISIIFPWNILNIEEHQSSPGYAQKSILGIKCLASARVDFFF